MSWRRWAGLSATLAVALVVGGVTEWRDQPPAPLGQDVPADGFSEARARPLMARLSGEIGHRVTGTAGQERAAAVLVEALRALPRVEVELQEAAGFDDPSRWGFVTAYRVKNVLARIPGRDRSAVLISAHYDSPLESVGAADNALAVAAAVEVARAIASGPELERSVILCLNDGEELGSMGVAAFAQHPWMRDVRAFINLDAAGLRGKSLLFQADSGALLRAYARAVPQPHGTVLGQEIFQSGVVPSVTDYDIYARRTPAPGLDLALYQDGYAYHTALDRLERVTPGSLQHTGANLLAVVRELASGARLDARVETDDVFYDLLGLWMPVYRERTGAALAGVTLGLLAAVLWRLVRAHQSSLAEMAAGLGAALSSVLAGVVGPLLAALVLAYVARRPQGWFAHPVPGVAGFAGVALAGALGAQLPWTRWFQRRSLAPERHALAAWIGGILSWSLLLGLAALARIKSGYVALWWVAPAVPALWLASVRPAWRGPVAVLSLVPGLVVTAQAALMVLEMFIPAAGRLALPIPFDPIIALLTALPVVGFAVVGMYGLHRAQAGGWPAAMTGIAGALILAGVALTSPYSPERPKRLEVRKQCDASGCTILLSPEDFIGLSDVAASLPGAVSLADEAGTYALPAEPWAPSQPAVAVTAEASGEGGATRKVRLRLLPGEHLSVELRLPCDAVLGWSLPQPPRSFCRHDGKLWLRGLAIPPGGWELALELRPAPVSVEVRRRYPPSPDLLTFGTKLPAWTAPELDVIWRETLEL